ncbi:hypothetical protein ACIB24_02410 [Spongisporangium articulatum]|uniref:Transcriptional regulator, AbiEi antitoxin, Type IV TA system n=1 Tax=Spongisporangium articulatum TaxID=3362603 RepID=A0ABW8AHS4_9ACTN
MRRPRPAPHALASGPFTLATGRAHETVDRLAGPAYRSLGRGLRQAAHLPVTFETRIAAMRQVLPAEAVLAGRAAAWVHGVRDASAEQRVEVILPRPGQVRARPGLVVRAEVLAPQEVLMTRFGPTTTAARTAYDLARVARLPPAAARSLHRRPPVETVPSRPPTGPALYGFPDPSVLRGEHPAAVARRLIGAVTAVDRLLFACKLSASHVDQVLDRHGRSRGVGSARVVLALADARAESPPESVLRCRFVLAGLPAPQPQYEIYDGTRFVARPDMSWLKWRLAAEYDGIYHDEVEGMPAKDRSRDVDAHGVGWELLHYDRFSLRDVARLIDRTHRVMLRRAG